MLRCIFLAPLFFIHLLLLTLPLVGLLLKPGSSEHIVTVTTSLISFIILMIPVSVVASWVYLVLLIVILLIPGSSLAVECIISCLSSRSSEAEAFVRVVVEGICLVVVLPLAMWWSVWLLCWDGKGCIDATTSVGPSPAVFITIPAIIYNTTNLILYIHACHNKQCLPEHATTHILPSHSNKH